MIDIVPSQPASNPVPDRSARPGGATGVSQQSSVGQRVLRQQAALLEIMRSGLLARELPEIFSRLTEVAARTLDVARVSIWRLNASGDAIVSDDQFLLDSGEHSQGAVLQAAHYPAYFEALRSHRVICAPDAARDPRTVELYADYLQPLSIVSMLDSAIWHHGERRGVVCVESVDVPREWTSDEQQFVGSIADLVALGIENTTRRVAQRSALASEQKVSQVFRLSPDCMVVTRIADGVVLEFSDSFVSQSGYLRDDVVGKTTAEVGMWVDAGARAQWLGRGISEGQVRGMEAEMRIKSGEFRTFQISSERISFEGEDCLLSVARDITTAKRQERMLFEIAQAVAAAAGDSFFVSLAERLSGALDADLAFIGEIDPAHPTQIQTIAAQRKGKAADNFRYSLIGSPCETILTLGVCAYAKDVAALFPGDLALGRLGIQAYVGAPLLDSDGRAMGLIAAMFSRPLQQTDLSIQLLRIFASRASAELERRNQLAALEFRATHDSLTGLHNRSSIEKRMDSSIRSGSGAKAALLLLDLDRFKEINDTLGHNVGDTLLARIAKRLADANDAGTMIHGTVARLGGDEFGIWLENLEG
ncbi:MAG: diguanylate cyclase, partial [Usitatibacteraceae bacterium]